MLRRLTGARSALAALVGIVGLTASACATAAPDITPQQITEVDLVIRRAVAAGADRLAPDLLASSREAYDAARRASFAHEPDEARRQLDEAKAYAIAAELQATAEQRQRAADAIFQKSKTFDSPAPVSEKRSRKC
jgi:hypothetical protein